MTDSIDYLEDLLDEDNDTFPNTQKQTPLPGNTIEIKKSQNKRKQNLPHGHVVNGFSKRAIFCAAVSIPLALLDLVFIRITLAEYFNWPQNAILPTWATAIAASIGALAIAFLAGGATTHRDKFNGKLFLVFSIIAWAFVGAMLFSFRLTAQYYDSDMSASGNVGMAVFFLCIFIVDGGLGFFAGRELLNVALWEFLGGKKRASRNAETCTNLMGKVQDRKARMHATQGELGALYESMCIINRTYVSQQVPRHMSALLHALRESGLWTGSADSLWEAIGYDPVTRKPISVADPVTGKSIKHLLFDEEI